MKESRAFTKENKLVFGIDLGTTNSCISIVNRDNIAKAITLTSGKTTMPSCIMWDSESDTIITGDLAYKNRYKSNACYSVKRLMGTSTKIKLIDKGKTKIMTPEEVSSEIIKGLVKQASTLYKNIKRCVVTVPAEFNNLQVEATKKAAELAGLEVMHILREPTSAALAYGLDKKCTQDSNVLVYDLGGGTFDVSLVRISSTSNSKSSLLSALDIDNSGVDKKTSISVIATDGDTKLGGDDLDLLIYKMGIDDLKRSGVDISKISKIDKEKALLEIEKCKKLENILGFSIVLPSLGNEKIQITVDDFKKATFKLFKKTRKYVDRLIKANNNVKIDKIILMGGSTKNKVLQDFIEKSYNTNIINWLNPDESVALGASIDAKRLAYSDSDLEIYDVLSGSIGMLVDGRVMKILNKNQTIPCANSVTLSNTSANPKVLSFNVYQGESIYVSKCTPLGELRVSNLPKGDIKERELGVCVTLRVDDNGLLSISCVHPDENKNNIEEDMDLVNLTGDTAKRESDSDSLLFVKLERWRKLAKTMDSSKAEEFLNLISEVEKCDNEENNRKVMNFIRG